MMLLPSTVESVPFRHQSVIHRSFSQSMKHRAAKNMKNLPPRCKRKLVLMSSLAFLWLLSFFRLRPSSLVNPLMDAPAAFVYDGGAIDVIELASKHVEPASNITAAICSKAMYGDLDIGLVLQWVAYHRLLGFDHIYMYYRPEMKNASRFDELQALPFVTLHMWMSVNWVHRVDQKIEEALCLSDPKLGGSYDWVMTCDTDEYLWLREEYDGVKAFLLQQQTQNMTYISLGKYMYTLHHRTDVAANNYKLDSMAKDSPFVLSKYPFHMKNYCNLDRIGDAICPGWKGRAKVIVKPVYYQWLAVHGIYEYPITEFGAAHYHPERVHFMEWPHTFKKHNVTKREPKDFTVKEEDDIHIHDLKTAFKTIDGTNYLVEYDDRLEQWFHRVINRARVPGAIS